MSLTLNMVGGSGGGELLPTDAVLRVQAPAESVVAISKGAVTKTDLGHEDEDDNTVYDYYFIIHQSQFDGVNPWTVTVTNSGIQLSQTITINASNEYDLVFLFEFGVSWDKSSSTSLTRLGDSANFASPVPVVGTGDGSSPFDNIYPWSGIKEFNVIDNALSYERGVDAEFSRSSYDTVVRIPKFYYKVVNDSNHIEFWISPIAKSGYELHPTFYQSDAVYVGKYLTSSGTYCKSGVSPSVNTAMATFFTNAKNKGSNWLLNDMMTYSAIWFLFLVEFADLNSQSAVGNGYSNSSSVTACGGTDSITYHTGAVSSGYSQVKYREIEDVWGNVNEWVNGLNPNGYNIYYCKDRSKYISSGQTNYTQAGYSLASANGGWIKSVGYDSNAPWLFLQTSVGGSNSTYLPDQTWTGTGNHQFVLSGGHGNTLGSGLFFQVTTSVGSSDNNTGARLLFVPS